MNDPQKIKIHIPPIKCQGIKSKLTPWVKETIDWEGEGKWIEPFFGSGVVGFNCATENALFCDSNPHIIGFYNAIQKGIIDHQIARNFLEQEGQKLLSSGGEYYYEVRNRFNRGKDPLDFLFLNRCCFNGMIRFNSKGGYNVPFGHKPKRFSKAYITKIVNQIIHIQKISKDRNWSFICQDFIQTLSQVTADDFVYCDPPYAGRHVDYYNGWSTENELELHQLLDQCPARFILSTWFGNQHRQNPLIDNLKNRFQVIKKEHFYHIGASEKNRKPMWEALVLNYTSSP